MPGDRLPWLPALRHRSPCLGTTIASVGFNIGLDPATLRYAIAMLMLAMGVVLLIPALQGRLAAFAAPVATGGQTLLDRIQPSGLGGQFVLGGLAGRDLVALFRSNSRSRDRTCGSG